MTDATQEYPTSDRSKDRKTAQATEPGYPVEHGGDDGAADPAETPNPANIAQSSQAGPQDRRALEPPTSEAPDARRLVDELIALVHVEAAGRRPSLALLAVPRISEARAAVLAALLAAPVRDASRTGADGEREMRDALRSVGIFRSDEAGDDGSEWCVTLEPNGEAPAGTLVDALRRTMQAAENDGRAMEREAAADMDDETRAAVDRLRAMTKGAKAGRADYGQFLSGRDAVLLTQHIDALTRALGAATPQPAPVEGAPCIVDDGVREWQWSPHVGLLTRFRGEHWGPAFADNITEANRPLIASLLASPVVPARAGARP